MFETAAFYPYKSLTLSLQDHERNRLDSYTLYQMMKQLVSFPDPFRFHTFIAVRGEMFWDDGDQIEILNFVTVGFSANKSSITSEPSISGTFTDMPQLRNLTIYGVEKSISSLQVTQGDTVGVNFNLSHGVLTTSELALSLLEAFTISWH